ncbi:hypothetical protein AB0P21_04150 [Kribbella sp. NPDC056861]|uniref:8-oxoguanine DNA glycosylase OGG fold protein n=1 Tax=Kribbella sp. NPDC056861 TaxID=3154857 RepID=UPI00343BBDDE
MVDSAPSELLSLHSRWNAAGQPQPPTRWMPRQWLRRMPERADYLQSLPNPITRSDVAAQFVGADQSEETAVRAFLAAMVWGYGRIGYGAYRTMGVLAGTERADARLLETLQVARSSGGMAGFEYMARNRLKGLGVAFGTKYLYFCMAGTDAETLPPAPILDSVVCDWLAVHDGWRPQIGYWKPRDYNRYCERVRDWAIELEQPQGTVEYLMFAGGIGIANQWGGLGTPAGTDSQGVPNSGVDAVLDALAEAVVVFEALSPSNEDLDAFRRGVRALEQLADTQAVQ